MFHLITHAFFKALLFLGSGSVIHGMEHGHHPHAGHAHGHHDDHDHFDPQDMRTMGGLRHKMPARHVHRLHDWLAGAGGHRAAGRFLVQGRNFAHASKNPGPIFFTVYIMLTVAAFCTAFYMGRQLKMVFFGKPRHAAAEHAEESSPLMTRPLMFWPRWPC
jgi:NADH-quinone oxidoreductase subunit L